MVNAKNIFIIEKVIKHHKYRALVNSIKSRNARHMMTNPMEMLKSKEMLKRLRNIYERIDNNLTIRRHERALRQQ